LTQPGFSPWSPSLTFGFPAPARTRESSLTKKLSEAFPHSRGCELPKTAKNGFCFFPRKNKKICKAKMEKEKNVNGRPMFPPSRGKGVPQGLEMNCPPPYLWRRTACWWAQAWVPPVGEFGKKRTKVCPGFPRGGAKPRPLCPNEGGPPPGFI